MNKWLKFIVVTEIRETSRPRITDVKAVHMKRSVTKVWCWYYHQEILETLEKH